MLHAVLGCAGRLLYTVDGVWGDSEVILDRRCPECEYREAVVVSVWTASARYREDTRTLLAMQVLADSLRDAFTSSGQDEPRSPSEPSPFQGGAHD